MDEFKLIELFDKCADNKEEVEIALFFDGENDIDAFDVLGKHRRRRTREEVNKIHNVINSSAMMQAKSMTRDNYNAIINSVGHSALDNHHCTVGRRVDTTKKPIDLRKKKSEPEWVLRSNFKVKVNCSDEITSNALSDMCTGYEILDGRIKLSFEVNSDSIKTVLHNVIYGALITHLKADGSDAFSMRYSFQKRNLSLSAHRTDVDFISEIDVYYYLQP